MNKFILFLVSFFIAVHPTHVSAILQECQLTGKNIVLAMVVGGIFNSAITTVCSVAGGLGIRAALAGGQRLQGAPDKYSVHDFCKDYIALLKINIPVGAAVGVGCLLFDNVVHTYTPTQWDSITIRNLLSHDQMSNHL